MPTVFCHSDDVIIVDEAWLETLRESARAQPLRRTRLNLHRDESDQIQEMVIVFCGDSLLPPHRQLGRTKSYHMVEGRLDVVLFGDDGSVTRRFRLGAAGTGLPTLYRLNTAPWHTVIPLDDIVIVHEVLGGPYMRELEPLPAWAPGDQDALAAFIRDLRVVS